MLSDLELELEYERPVPGKSVRTYGEISSVHVRVSLWRVATRAVQLSRSRVYTLL